MDETVAELRRTAAELCEDARIARENAREQRLATRALVQEMKEVVDLIARSRLRGPGNRA
jgi:hypothetical protein